MSLSASNYDVQLQKFWWYVWTLHIRWTVYYLYVLEKQLPELAVFAIHLCSNYWVSDCTIGIKNLLETVWLIGNRTEWYYYMFSNLSYSNNTKAKRSTPTTEPQDRARKSLHEVFILGGGSYDTGMVQDWYKYFRGNVLVWVYTSRSICESILSREGSTSSTKALHFRRKGTTENIKGW